MNEEKPTLEATVGLPQAGKTTWAKKQGLPIVCPDYIRLALHGQRYVAEAEQMVWTIAKIMVRSLFLSGHKHVILCATSVTRKRRAEWLSSQWRTIFVWFPTPEHECVNRAVSQNDVEIVPVIARMAAEFEPFSKEELEAADVLVVDKDRILNWEQYQVENYREKCL